MATSSAMGLTDTKAPKSREKAVLKINANAISHLPFGDMNKELEGFLCRIRRRRKMEDRQLILPGFEKFAFRE